MEFIRRFGLMGDGVVEEKIAEIAREQGDLARAEKHFRRALKTAQPLLKEVARAAWAERAG